MRFWELDFDSWFEAVKYHADNYGVLYMVAEGDPVLVDSFEKQMQPDDFVIEVLLGDVVPDEDEDD